MSVQQFTVEDEVKGINILIDACEIPHLVCRGITDEDAKEQMCDLIRSINKQLIIMIVRFAKQNGECGIDQGAIDHAKAVYKKFNACQRYLITLNADIRCDYLDIPYIFGSFIGDVAMDNLNNGIKSIEENSDLINHLTEKYLY